MGEQEKEERICFCRRRNVGTETGDLKKGHTLCVCVFLGGCLLHTEYHTIFVRD